MTQQNLLQRGFRAASSIVAALQFAAPLLTRALTGITLASNFGTFVLYALTCLWTIIAFQGSPARSVLKHLIVPGLGLIANVAMLVTILGEGMVGGGAAQAESLIAIAFAAFWAIISAVYVVMANRRTGRALMAVPTTSAPASR